jgi:hypothetical protein
MAKCPVPPRHTAAVRRKNASTPTEPPVVEEEERASY